jgi:hypothetical protein
MNFFSRPHRRSVPNLGLMIILALGLLAFGTNRLSASIAYGSINNFDTVNDTGHECHGFEIELEDCHSTDITYTYNYNHYGVPEITEDNSVPGHPKCVIRWHSKKNPDGSWAAYTAIPSGPIAPTNGHMFTNPAVNFGGEHFGVGYRTQPSAVRYRWLIDNGAGMLMAGGDVQVSTPTFTYNPPVAAMPAQVQAVIAPPPPPAPEPKEFGKPIWVKEIRTTTHNNREVKLRDLVSDDPDDDHDKNWRNGEPDEVEVEWQVLQTDYKRADGANNKLAAEAEDLPGGDEVVTRRYEFYKYIGPVDDESGEAKAQKVGPDGIHGEGIKRINGVDVDLSTVAIVGDYTGAQMAAVDVDAPVGLIDHVGEARMGEVFAPRTVVVQGALPFVSTFAGVLPLGMDFDEVTGVLSGTPEESGLFEFTITASDGVNAEVKKNYVLAVAEMGAELPPLALLDTSVDPPASGVTTGDGAYDIWGQATITARPAPGFVFLNWTDNGEVVSSLLTDTVTMDVNHSVVAHFAPDTTVQITQQPQGVTADPGSTATFAVVATAPGPITYQWRRNGVALPGAIQATLVIADVMEIDEGDYDVVLTDAAGSRPSAIAHLNVTDVAIAIADLTPSMIVSVNAPVTLQVAAAGAGPFEYQWLKDDIAIPGAISDSYVLPAARLLDAGIYQVQVTGAAVVKSDPVFVAVADDRAHAVSVLSGKTITFEVACEGGGLSFAWSKDGQPLAADSRIKGVNQRKLTVDKVGPGDEGLYKLEISGHGATFTTQGHQLTIIDEPPVITEDPPSFPAAVVSGDFMYAIPTAPDPARTPSGYLATGLPPGLKLDSKTGVISGRPTATAKDPLGYLVKLTAFNAIGRTTVSGRLLVQGLGGGVVGEFTGPVERSDSLNEGLGGLITLNVMPSGAFTGRLALGAKLLPFRGVLEASVGSAPHGTASVSRQGAGPLTLTFNVDAANMKLEAAAITDGAASAAVSAWRNGSAGLGVKSSSEGYHTFLLDLPPEFAGRADVPQGNGYGSITITATGRVMMTGKMADGEMLTSSTFAGPNGEVAVYRLLYDPAHRGSVVGRLDVRADLVSGSLTWSKPAQAASKRLYADGFAGLIPLTAVGGRYQPPVAPQVLLDLDAGVANAQLWLLEGGAGITAPLEVSIGEHNRTTVLTPPLQNPRKVTLNLTPKSGIVRGTFVMEDANPLPPPALPRLLKRTVPFEGISVPTAGGMRSGGFFLLPQLPLAPSEVTPVLSGQVLLEKAVK